MKFNLTIYGLLLAAVVQTPTLEAAVSPMLTAEQRSMLREGDLDRLREALDQGLKIDARDAAGNTPLILEAGYGSAAAIRLLLERGADANATNLAGATALMRGAWEPERVRLLLQHGADPSRHSAFDTTALLVAARTVNSHRTVQLLLEHGAEARATNRFGVSPLMAAAAGGDIRSVKLLIQHGAEVNAQPSMDHAAFIFGGGRSALMWAAYRGDLPIMKVLLKAGADVNAEGLLGTPLSQAAWANQTAAARLLLEQGANPNQRNHMEGYTPLHWAASSESSDSSLVQLLLRKGADPNAAGGENIDAFMDVLQTPLMLARKRGETAALAALIKGGATNETPERVSKVAPARALGEHVENEFVRNAISHSVPLLERTALESKQSFIRHESKQDCTSCHQQHLPLAALGVARKQQGAVDPSAYQELVKMISDGELKTLEPDWEPIFHPDPAFTKGYELFGFTLAGVPAGESTDAWVHHLTAIQGKEGQWHSNLPRPPIQSGDIAATALAINGLQHYPLPGRKAEFAARVERARRWLWAVRADNNEERVYQLLGLSWSGEPRNRLQGLVKELVSQQQSDGGWAQLPKLQSDAYATGQALYALQTAGGLTVDHSAVDRGHRYLLESQLDDGSWYVHRRAFPFQPTMKSGFPHGRDSWISCAATSWAIIGLSCSETTQRIAQSK